MQYMGTLNGREEARENWYATYEVNFAFDVVMENNVAAGSERSGFRIDGESCDATQTWFNNTAHSTLMGVVMITDLGDGIMPCSAINGFITWRNYFWGMFLESEFNLQILNHISVDDTVGLYPFVVKPSSLKHEYEDKFVTINSSSYVGTSSSFDCEAETAFGAAITGSEKPYSNIMQFADLAVSFRAGEDGRSGITFASFSSGGIGAPGHPFKGIMAYQAINGYTMASGE